MQTDTGSNVDARFQCSASIEIVTVIEVKGHFLMRSGVQTVTDTYTDKVVLIDGHTIHENTCPAYMSAEEKSVLY